MPNRVDFGAKDPGATTLLGFDFTSQLLPNGETILTASFNVTVWTGSDPSPNSMISGVPLVGTPAVLQRFAGGVNGTVYKLECTVTTSLSQTLVLVGYLSVDADPL